MSDVITDSQLAEWERQSPEMYLLVAEVRRLREERGLDLKAGADALLETMTERNQLSQRLAAALEALRELYGEVKRHDYCTRCVDIVRAAKAAAILENANAKD